MVTRPSPAHILAAGVVALAVGAALGGCGLGRATLADEGPLRPVRLTFSIQPEYAVAGQPIGPGVAVTVLDSQGDTSYSSTASIQLSIELGTGNAAALLHGTTQMAAVNGTASFPDLSIDSAGSGYRLFAASGGLGGAVSDSFNVTHP